MMKFVLLLALVPLVLGSPEDMMKFMKMMKMMKEEKSGGMSGEMQGENGMEHFEGDGDCKSKEEAMKKKFMMWEKMEKMKAMMEKKREMEEGMERMKKFHEFSEMMKKKKEMEEMEKKKKMWEMYEKHQEMKRKQEKEGEFNDLIESFTAQKHKFAYSLTHHFLTMCKCGDIDYQMNQMFTGERMGNSSGMAEGMGEEKMMEMWAKGDMAGVAEMLKKMPKEEQKKLYMSGLIRSMCSGAKTYINTSRQFEEQYMKDGNNQNRSTPDPFSSP